MRTYKKSYKDIQRGLAEQGGNGCVCEGVFGYAWKEQKRLVGYAWDGTVEIQPSIEERKKIQVVYKRNGKYQSPCIWKGLMV